MYISGDNNKKAGVCCNHCDQRITEVVQKFQERSLRLLDGTGSLNFEMFVSIPSQASQLILSKHSCY